VKVRVDSDKCQGHNRCMAFAPEIFDVDDYGFAFVREPDVQVPTEREDQVWQAAASCPELAILVDE